jgi:hypothetical protein
MKIFSKLMFFGIFSLISCISRPADVSTIYQAKEVKLVKVISDSRCPRKTECIWAGEITFLVVALENEKISAQRQFTIRGKAEPNVVNWFVRHLPVTQNAKLADILVLPYPESEGQIRPDEYFFKFIYL